MMGSRPAKLSQEEQAAQERLQGLRDGTVRVMSRAMARADGHRGGGSAYLRMARAGLLEMERLGLLPWSRETT